MKILYITTIGPTMGFFKSFICKLIEDGNTVDIAANVSESDVPEYYREWGCSVYSLSCTRHPYDKRNIKAIKQIRQIVIKGKYDIVHCHTPIAAACTRFACRKIRKNGTKVIYTAHGFHFYKGAPLKNWLLYYPAEWICAFWTDVLITINKEDYACAKKHLHAKQVEYVPGVGIDLKNFSFTISEEEKCAKRNELGIFDGDKLILSVGELNANKNHEIVIRAISKLKDKRIHYAIAGSGTLYDYLTGVAHELGISDRVHLLGFRNDVADLYQIADLFIHPSIREGLPLAVMEAIAARIPVICSKIRGNADLVNEFALFDCRDVDGLADKISMYLHNDCLKEINTNYEALRKYDLSGVISQMNSIYLGG